MMFKVLIADDEPKIRKGIKGILDWQQLGFEIVAEAEDGEVALELACEKLPDLLLVDICMPFLNGLEFIARLQTMLKDAVIIIISGHDEFEYAQTALKLKVFDYILKPVEKEVLLKSILQAKEHMIEIKSKNIQDEFIAKQLKKNSHYLKDMFLQELICGKVKAQDINERLNYFQIERTANMGMIIIKPLEKNYGIIETEWDNDLLTYAIANIAQEAMGAFKAVTCFKDLKNQVILLSDTHPIGRWTEMGSWIERCVEDYLKREIITEAILLNEELKGIETSYQTLCSIVAEKNQKTPIVITIQKYIDKHYANPELSLTEIADHIGISQTYLTRLLKQELGLPFIDYLTQVRLKKAVMLMQDPNIKVYEVAEKVGYSSQHYFSNVFKKTFNMSPLEYKKGGMK